MAAARNILQMRRLLSVLANHNQQPYFSPVNKESTQQLFPCASTIFTRSDFYRRFQTQTSAAGQPTEESEDHETDNLKHGCDSANVPSQISCSEDSGVKHSATSSLKISPRHDLAMIFTCKVCETRSVKTTCRESYEKGVVVVRCDGCNNLHLMADRLGWFGAPGSIEDFLAARGEDVKKGSEATLSLTLEDLAGSSILKE
ncbi:uncharacterized protein [Euphorbia lathyris]|uniref:uncharacterized protein n=1 Tax=Euphorbia lathyris TaxID=212925 RepID=UPI0033133F46